MEDLLQVGAIANTHGVRGEVKVFTTTDDPARFKKLKKVIPGDCPGEFNQALMELGALICVPNGSPKCA